MRHKIAIMVAVVVFQLIMIWAAELLVRRDAAVVLNGAFQSIKETSISSYITRNPNNLPLFLYERFFYNLFGVVVASGIFYGITGYLLNPMIAGLAMGLSSVSVVLNALRLKKFK